MTDDRARVIENALRLSKDTSSDRVFFFLNSVAACHFFLSEGICKGGRSLLVVPKSVALHALGATDIKILQSWSGNQSRFSRIKYAFLQAVLQKEIQMDSKVVCVLGPWGTDHLDTITIHDLAHSWSEEFPFDPRPLITRQYLNIVMAVIDIALDIGALGREGKSVGTTFIIGNVKQIMRASHQAVFNPFRGYGEEARNITSAEVVESIKELAKLDGAFVVSESGVVEAAGRHLDAVSTITRQLKGLGSRHRAAAGMTMQTESVAVVVSESTGKVSIFDKGKVIASLEPVISRRLV